MQQILRRIESAIQEELADPAARAELVIDRTQDVYEDVWSIGTILPERMLVQAGGTFLTLTVTSPVTGGRMFSVHIDAATLKRPYDHTLTKMALQCVDEILLQEERARP